MREEDKNTKGGKDGYLRSVFFFSFVLMAIVEYLGKPETFLLVAALAIRAEEKIFMMRPKTGS